MGPHRWNERRQDQARSNCADLSNPAHRSPRPGRSGPIQQAIQGGGDAAARVGTGTGGTLEGAASLPVPVRAGWERRPGSRRNEDHTLGLVQAPAEVVDDAQAAGQGPSRWPSPGIRRPAGGRPADSPNRFDKLWGLPHPGEAPSTRAVLVMKSLCSTPLRPPRRDAHGRPDHRVGGRPEHLDSTPGLLAGRRRG